MISARLARLRKTPERVLISRRQGKIIALKASIRTLAPTTFVTDEQTALALHRLAEPALSECHAAPAAFGQRRGDFRLHPRWVPIECRRSDACGLIDNRSRQAPRQRDVGSPGTTRSDNRPIFSFRHSQAISPRHRQEVKQGAGHRREQRPLQPRMPCPVASEPCFRLVNRSGLIANCSTSRLRLAGSRG